MHEAKTKHLEFIQTTINRMASNSFLLKGWTITLVGGLIALTFKETDPRYLYISAIVVALFWLLDSYYLSQEGRFILLYDHVRKKSEASIDFAMNAHEFGGRWCWLECAFSKTILLFYGGLVVVQLVINYFITK